MDLRVSTWNINGLKASIRDGSLLAFLNRDDRPDIVCLQEIKISGEADFAPIRAAIDALNYTLLLHHDPEKKGYAGVATLVNRSHPDLEHMVCWDRTSFVGRVLECEFLNFVVVNVYVPNAGRKLDRHDYRTTQWDLEFKDYIVNRKEATGKPVIICGDFNVAHRRVDLARPGSNLKTAGFTPMERENFTVLLEDGELVDTWRTLHPDTVGVYSYWSYLHNAREKNIGWRIDYILASRELQHKIKASHIQREQVGSDHAPIVTVFNNL
jgi:exodeoxyribonuclease-3